MPEMITPEIITIAIASLAAFTFLLTLIILVVLSRVRKRLFTLEVKSLEFNEKDELLDASEKVSSFDSRLTMSLEEISENKNQLMGYETKLNDHAEMFGKVSQMMDQQAANITTIYEKITSIDSCLERLNNSITESQYQLKGYESKLNEHDNLLGENSRLAGKNATDLNQAFKQIESLDGKYQEIKVFRSAVEKTCGIISNAFSSIQSTALSDDTLTVERRTFQEEVKFPS